MNACYLGSAPARGLSCGARQRQLAHGSCCNWARGGVSLHRSCAFPSLGGRHHPAGLCRASQSRNEDTLQSLDSLLSSKDSQDEDDTSLQYRRPARRRRRPDAAERRARPLYVYVLYYCYIVVYLAAAWLEWTDGDLAASALIDGLVNDHLAVVSGEVTRLATSGYVCSGPLELFMQLATLLTVGAEVEALLGPSLFWAVYWLASLAGSAADAGFSELPITQGPANAAAGMVGALVAYYLRNLGLEERLAEARRLARARKAGALGREVINSRDSLDEAEAEVEFLPFLTLKLRQRLTTTGRALLSVLVALVVAGEGLLEFGGASSSASWIGLLAAFQTGAFLSFGAGPHYEIQDAALQRPSGSKGRSAPAAGGEGSGSAADGVSGDAAHAAQQQGDSDGLSVVNLTTAGQSSNIIIGFMLFMGAAIASWLVWEGTDI